MNMKNPVLVACVVLCISAVIAYLFVGGPPSEDNRVAQKFSSAMNGNASTAIPICMNETPFKAGEKTYYGRTCLLEVACKIKPSGKKNAVEACREIDSIPILKGDQNISSDACISYVDKNC